MDSVYDWYGEVNFTPTPEQVIELGDNGGEVYALQEKLRLSGYSIKSDGDFGPATQRAVLAFQKTMNLPQDGRVGPTVSWFLTHQKLDPRFLSHLDIERAALRLGASVASVMAIREVESRGSGYFSNGEPAILFERHVMRKRLLHNGMDAKGPMRLRPDLVNTLPGGYVGGVAEYTRLNDACAMDETSAMESCSWGMFQVMGYHWQRLGYASVQSYVEYMRESEAQQLEAFVRFIEADPELHQALVTLTWLRVAELYNGPKQQGYDKRLKEAFEKYRRLLSPKVSS